MFCFVFFVTWWIRKHSFISENRRSAIVDSYSLAHIVLVSRREGGHAGRCILFPMVKFDLRGSPVCVQDLYERSHSKWELLLIDNKD